MSGIRKTSERLAKTKESSKTEDPKKSTRPDAALSFDIDRYKSLVSMEILRGVPNTWSPTYGYKSGRYTTPRRNSITIEVTVSPNGKLEEFKIVKRNSDTDSFTIGVVKSVMGMKSRFPKPNTKTSVVLQLSFENISENLYFSDPYQ